MSAEQETLNPTPASPEEQEVDAVSSIDRRRFIGVGIGRLVGLIAGGAILFKACEDDRRPAGPPWEPPEPR